MTRLRERHEPQSTSQHLLAEHAVCPWQDFVRKVALACCSTSATFTHGGTMAKKTVFVSDLSGKEIEDARGLEYRSASMMDAREATSST